MTHLISCSAVIGKEGRVVAKEARVLSVVRSAVTAVRLFPPAYLSETLDCAVTPMHSILEHVEQHGQRLLVKCDTTDSRNGIPTKQRERTGVGQLKVNCAA